MTRIIKKESLVHREAFEFYYKGGSERSYAKVSKQFNTSITSVNRWSQSFKWMERIVERERRIGDNVAAKIESLEIKSREDMVEVLGNKISSLIEIIDGKPHLTVSVSNFSEFNDLVKLFLLLRGDPTENTLVRVEYVEIVVNFVLATITKHVKDPSVIALISRDLETMPKMDISNVQGPSGGKNKNRDIS